MCFVYKAFWSFWTPWIQLGNHDIRIRRCQGQSSDAYLANGCHGDSVEVRNCAQTGTGRRCRSENEDLLEEKQSACLGLNLDDVENIGRG